MNWDALDQLSLSEDLRFGCTLTNFFNSVEHHYRQLNVSHWFDEKASAGLANVVNRRLALPGIADWWQQNVEDLEEEFVQWVESVRNVA